MRQCCDPNDGYGSARLHGRQLGYRRMAQRLVRKICTRCKHPITLSEAVLQDAGLPMEVVPFAKFSKGKGCPYCQKEDVSWPYRDLRIDGGQRATERVYVLRTILRRASRRSDKSWYDNTLLRWTSQSHHRHYDDGRSLQNSQENRAGAHRNREGCQRSAWISVAALGRSSVFSVLFSAN